MACFVAEFLIGKLKTGSKTLTKGLKHGIQLHESTINLSEQNGTWFWFAPDFASEQNFAENFELLVIQVKQ